MLKHIGVLIASLCFLGACTSTQTATRDVQAEGSSAELESPPLPEHLAHIRYSGGDGSSCSTPIVISKAKNTSEGISAENAWILWMYPGAVKTGQDLVHSGQKVFDLVEFTTSDGEELEVCFDITGFFGKW